MYISKILTNTGYIGIDTLKNWLGLNKPPIIIQTFATTVNHGLADANTGKSFSIPNFPNICTIREIRLRSNFIAGQQIRQTICTINDPNGLLPTDTLIQLSSGWINQFAVGDYIYLDDEIVYVSTIDTTNQTLTVTRGIKGTVPTYHNNNARLEIANNGIKLILFKNISKKFAERIKNLHMLMTWKGNTNIAIIANDKIIKFSNPIVNVGQYDLLYINDTSNPESVIIEKVNNSVINATYNNTIFVADQMLAHVTNVEVQKYIVYDIPIPYSGDSTLYGILYVDESIDQTLYPSGIIANIEIVVESR